MTEPLQPAQLIELLSSYGREPQIGIAEIIGRHLQTLVRQLEREEGDQLQRLLGALEYHPEQLNTLLSRRAPWRDLAQYQLLAELAEPDEAVGELAAAIEESLNDLEARYSIAPDSPDCRIELALSEHGSEVGLWNLRYAIQIGPEAAPVLWDSAHGASRHPAALALRLAALDLRVFVHQQEPLARTQAIPSYHLHPERYLYTRSYVQPLVKQRQDRRWQRSTLATHLEEGRTMSRSQHSDASNFCLRPHLTDPETDQEIQRVERLLLDVYSDLLEAGRHIHILTPLQQPRVRQLAVDGLTLGQLNGRRKAYFIHFGRQPELQPSPGLFIDGVYVLHSADPRMLVLFFTCLPDHADLAFEWWRIPEVVFPIAFDGPLLDTTVGEALSMTLRSHELVNRPRRAGPGENPTSLKNGDDPASRRINALVDAIRLACKAMHFLAHP